MPKLAATLASLLLIASSIGVNIARYPQVGRTLDPPSAEIRLRTANPSQTGTVGSMVGETRPVETAATRGLKPGKAEIALPAVDEQQSSVKQEVPAVPVAAKPAPPVQPEPTVPIIDVWPVAESAARQAAAIFRRMMAKFGGCHRWKPMALGLPIPISTTDYPTTATP